VPDFAKFKVFIRAEYALDFLVLQSKGASRACWGSSRGLKSTVDVVASNGDGIRRLKFTRRAIFKEQIEFGKDGAWVRHG
jgi:hypothetical protein